MTPGIEQPRTINTYDNPDASCLCVTAHNPNAVELHIHHIWPIGMGGPDEPANEVLVCPTTHSKVHRLLREAVKAGTDPANLPWNMRRAFGAYAVTVAQSGYQQWKAAQ